MRILLVEDETLTRAELKHVLLTLEPTLTLFEAGNASAALTLARSEAPDAVFLDINLPGRSGLELAADLSALGAPPRLVFSTAYSVHALAAFELAAVDYLVKPYREGRVAETLQRLRTSLAQTAVPREGRIVGRAGEGRTAPHCAALDRLWAARPDGGGVLLDYAEVCWLGADGKAVNAHTRRGERHALKGTLREWEVRLAAHGFVRTHKSYLVNLAQVTELEPWFSGAYVLRVADQKGSTVPLSRQYAKRLKAQTGWL